MSPSSKNERRCLFCFSIGRWLVPEKPSKPKPFNQRLRDLMPYQFSVNYWRNNKQFLTFLGFIIIVNIVLFVTRAYYFRDFSMLSGARPNPFYMMSRANGTYYAKLQLFLLQRKGG